MLHFYPKFVIRTFVLLVTAVLKPLNSLLKIQVSHGHQARWSTCVSGAFTLLSPTRKDPALQSRIHPVPPPVRAGDLEFGLLPVSRFLFLYLLRQWDKPKDQEYVRGYTVTHSSWWVVESFVGFAGGGLWYKRWDCLASGQRGWGRSQLLRIFVPVISNQSFPFMLVVEATKRILHFDPWLLLPLTLLLPFVLSLCTKEGIYGYSGVQQQALGREVIQSLEGC